MFSQIPLPPAGAIESWLISAAAVVAMIALGKKLFVRKPPIEAEFVSKAEFRMFRENVERELNGLRDKIDARFLSRLLDDGSLADAGTALDGDALARLEDGDEGVFEFELLHGWVGFVEV